MFATTGFTFLTFAILLAGIAVHSLKQFRTAKANQADITFNSYFLEHWPETVTAAIGSIVLWAGLPEIAQLMPDFASSIGLSGDVGIVSSFVCGFVGNSLADLIGGRAKSLGG